MEQIFAELVAFAIIGFILNCVVMIIKKITGKDLSENNGITEIKVKFFLYQ